MDIKKIERLMELMKAHQLAEIEVDEKGDRVRISMVTANATPAAMLQQPIHFPAPAAVAAAKVDTAGPAETRKTMRSPFVGTFYAAPSPEAATFVKAGQTVRQGETLCIIEAMKLMNEIEAEADTTILEVLVKNGQAVEFDQPLFAIK